MHDMSNFRNNRKVYLWVANHHLTGNLAEFGVTLAAHELYWHAQVGEFLPEGGLCTCAKCLEDSSLLSRVLLQPSLHLGVEGGVCAKFAKKWLAIPIGEKLSHGGVAQAFGEASVSKQACASIFSGGNART